ncbi:DUF2247 family protein [Streptomyces kaniharaensis]|uniref:DUF2247 family protein n=1 Tax=Streptomyces kaniharaensis TaxID=212423 RepID=A0A6N7KZB1_9ACTN|nr:DUF2247 family protein [Streptomyces kaniharaensis]MQS16761.1 DUF2247 family protein [Streptomyces kaniharaensis]
MSDLLKFKIPADFIEPHVHLSLAELEYGHREGWIDADGVIGLCTRRLVAGHASQLEETIALLLSDEADQVAGILEGADAGRAVDDVRPVWRYLALAWAYENREGLGDALGVVEMLYADFDYPSEMDGFVRYMPAQPGQKTGIDALMSRWEEFVRSEGEFYRGRDRESETG